MSTQDEHLRKAEQDIRWHAVDVISLLPTNIEMARRVLKRASRILENEVNVEDDWVGDDSTEQSAPEGKPMFRIVPITSSSPDDSKKPKI